MFARLDSALENFFAIFLDKMLFMQKLTSVSGEGLKECELVVISVHKSIDKDVVHVRVEVLPSDLIHNCSENILTFQNLALKRLEHLI